MLREPEPGSGSEFAMRGLDRSLPMVLLWAREATIGLFRPMFADNGLTEQQWRVLRALASDRAPMDAGELADTTFLLAPSLSRILATLEGQSLIERATPEHDRRRSIVSLSDAGRELVARIAPSSEAIYEELEDRFGAERLESLIAELDALSAIGPPIAGRDRHRRRSPNRPPSTPTPTSRRSSAGSTTT